MRVQLQRDASAGNFAKQLMDIGNGRMKIDESTQCITLPANFCKITESIDELVQKVFPNIAQNYKNHQWHSTRAILSAKNIDVNTINFIIQHGIPSETTTYKSIDTVENQDEVVNYPTEFLNSLDLPGIPPHVLILKIGVPIILLRNINPPRLCNGTRLSVKKMMNNVIEATILTGKFKGEDVLLPRIPMIPTDMPFEFKRLQFPVRLAFAMTINKAQGQSLQVCGLNLENPCFSHGQLYVACSRVGKPSDLFVYAPDGKTRNIVYPQHFNKHLIETELCNQKVNNVIEATILTGKFKGEDVLLPRIPMIPTDMPFEFKRLQFPVRLAFAMTINKAQGQSLQVCGLNLENPCFSHGQLYVACSRVGKPSHLFVYAPDGKTRNIVYPTALQ
ncbi:ATP-dependent DNA helicase [Trichonephila clavipes]|nr:ATP-dependent DNA helicase [Trichonephila clavipes]